MLRPVANSPVESIGDIEYKVSNSEDPRIGESISFARSNSESLFERDNTNKEVVDAKSSDKRDGNDHNSESDNDDDSTINKSATGKNNKTKDYNTPLTESNSKLKENPHFVTASNPRISVETSSIGNYNSMMNHLPEDMLFPNSRILQSDFLTEGDATTNPSNQGTLVPSGASSLYENTDKQTQKSRGGGGGFSFLLWIILLSLLGFGIWKLYKWYKTKRENERQAYRMAQADRVLGDMQMIPTVDHDDNELL